MSVCSLSYFHVVTKFLPQVVVEWLALLGVFEVPCSNLDLDVDCRDLSASAANLCYNTLYCGQL